MSWPTRPQQDCPQASGDLGTAAASFFSSSSWRQTRPGPAPQALESLGDDDRDRPRPPRPRAWRRSTSSSLSPACAKGASGAGSYFPPLSAQSTRPPSQDLQPLPFTPSSTRIGSSRCSKRPSHGVPLPPLESFKKSPSTPALRSGSRGCRRRLFADFCAVDNPEFPASTPSQQLQPHSRDERRPDPLGPSPGHVQRNSRPRSQPSDPELPWELLDELGSGGFGRVFKARWLRSSQQGLQPGDVLAIKEARKGREKNEVSLHRELAVCQTLRHKNIVGFLGHEEMQGRLYLYLEFVDGGSLRERLSASGMGLQGSILRRSLRDVAKGLCYLHEHNVLHRDLKCANVLVKGNFEVLKLADFGCAKVMETGMDLTLNFPGTGYWMAPELICDLGYGLSSDIWSFGCVVIEMATAEKPWNEKGWSHPNVAITFIMSNPEATPEVPSLLPTVGQDLVRRCCQRLPDARPTAAQLVQDAFLRRSERRLEA